VLPDDNGSASLAEWKAVLAKTKTTSTSLQKCGVSTAVAVVAVAVDERSTLGSRDGVDSLQVPIVSGEVAGGTSTQPIPIDPTNLDTTTPMRSPRKHVDQSSSSTHTTPASLLKDKLRLVVAAIEEEKRYSASLHKGLVQHLAGSRNSTTSDK
jgi:hypothetical protein